jgi:hypothetical protein
MPKMTPSKLQRKAALRVDRLAPSDVDLFQGNAAVTPGFETFVGTANSGTSDTPRRKIAAARRIAVETRKRPKGGGF